MKIEWGLSNESYGLGVMWDTPLKGRNVHGTLAQNMLMFMLINLTCAIYWGGNDN